MTLPPITSHPKFRELSNDFFKPYPPYVLVNSTLDAKAVLGAGCEAEYLVVLDAEAPEGTKSLSSTSNKEFKARIGVLIFTLSNNPSLEASQPLDLLAAEGTMIGFASHELSDPWKIACTEWAKQQKTLDTTGQEQGSVRLEWDTIDQGEWIAWTLAKKAPEWAFC